MSATNSDNMLWNTLHEVIELWESDRPKAARSAWAGIPVDLRTRVLKFVVALLEAEEDEVASFPRVECDSWFGKVTLTNQFLRQLMLVIPEVNR